MIIHNDDNTCSLISGDKWRNEMIKPVAEVIEWEETYGHTFKKRTVSTVKWLENVEVGTKLYTHPVKQLSDEEINALWLVTCNKAGEIEDMQLHFARAILREAQEK